MAYAFLRALGVDGDIGTITVDVKDVVTNFRSLRETMKDDAELDALLDALYKKLSGKQAELQENARAAVKPVTHKLSIRATA